MANEELRTMTIALAIGLPLMLSGSYGLKRWQPSLTIRVILGVVMLFSGVALFYPLIFGSGDLMQSPIRFGICIPLVGLGINQATAPWRVATGRAA